jgi:hypothetical protein
VDTNKPAPDKGKHALFQRQVHRCAMGSVVIAYAIAGDQALMPPTVFDIKGVPGHRRERIEAAVVAGGKHAQGPL